MAKCYICKERLDKSNSSIEHIIPNALGGNLKSRNLICKNCNSKMGLEEDAILAEQLNFIANMLDIRRDRGQPQPIEVEDKEKGKKYRLLPGGKPEMIKPEIEVVNKVDEEGQRKINVIARDKKQAKSVLKGLQRKYNISKQQIEEILETIQIKEEYFKEDLSFKSMFGGEKALRAIAKIGLNFYIYSGGNIKWIEDFIDNYLDESFDILSRISFIYLNHDVVEKHEDEILHSILIIGDSDENMLYGYVELFNAYRGLILLNDSYEGPSLKFSYFFDVENRRERNRKYKLKLSQTEMIRCLKKDNELYKNNIERLITEMNNLMRIIYSRHQSEMINKIIKDAFEKMDNKYPQEDNPYITPEMVSFLSREISEKYVTYLIKTDKLDM